MKCGVREPLPSTTARSAVNCDGASVLDVGLPPSNLALKFETNTEESDAVAKRSSGQGDVGRPFDDDWVDKGELYGISAGVQTGQRLAG